jgi:hypothetical protein
MTVAALAALLDRLELNGVSGRAGGTCRSSSAGSDGQRSCSRPVRAHWRPCSHCGRCGSHQRSGRSHTQPLGMYRATPEVQFTLRTRRNAVSGCERTQQRSLTRHIVNSAELLARSGWPTASAIALAVGRDRSTVAEHFRNPRFDAWFNSECDRFLASARSKRGRNSRRWRWPGACRTSRRSGGVTRSGQREQREGRWQRGRVA